LDYAPIRRKLARWYMRHHRDLPWRATRDPYAVWISEIMLQQTRVAAVMPYYQRFLARFPTPQALAAAPETEVLALWAGLGYYSRARNLHRAARQIAAQGAFPSRYESIRALAGVGDYTAAAIASIAFDLPYAAVDGNVRRVVARLAGDPAPDTAGHARALLDPRHPGRSNQALMELGALVCLPRDPLCPACPVRAHCAAHRGGIQNQLPPPRGKSPAIRKERTLLLIRRGGRLLVVPSPRVQGFWDLPEPWPGARPGARLGAFRHAITNSQYIFEVREARVRSAPAGARWWDSENNAHLPLSTVTKKALRCLGPI
jgi:A/G-specific adenine glycosylase